MGNNGEPVIITVNISILLFFLKPMNQNDYVDLRDDNCTDLAIHLSEIMQKPANNGTVIILTRTQEKQSREIPKRYGIKTITEPYEDDIKLTIIS